MFHRSQKEYLFFPGMFFRADVPIFSSLSFVNYNKFHAVFSPPGCGLTFADNPWKESFRQLYKGVHVRPGWQAKVEANPERWLFYNGSSSNSNDHR